MLVHVHNIVTLVRACLHGGKGTQIGETTCGGSPHLSCNHDRIKMRGYMDRRVTPPKRVISPTWGSPPPYKQALSLRSRRDHLRNVRRMRRRHTFFAAKPQERRLRAAKTCTHAKTIDFLACLFCFPISDNIMVLQRTFSFKCRLIHVNPPAYVCIITEILFTEIFLFSFLFFKICVCLPPPIRGWKLS